MGKIRMSHSAPVSKFRNEAYNSVISYNDRRKRGPQLSVEQRQYLAWLIDNKCMELERAHAGQKECEAARKELIKQIKTSGGEKVIEFE